MMDLLDTISKGEIESLNKLGGEERNIILKKAIVKEARFNYTEFNMPYIKNIFEGDHLSYDVINIDINYDNRDLSMSGSIGNGSMGTFEMKGNLAFSEGGITFAGDSIIRNFFMNCVWPFYYERLSAIIEDGRLTMVSHFYINDGILDVKNSVRIIDFKLSPRTPRDNILGLPQDEVINHLKDEKGRINFDFTIKGPLSDPKFSLSEEFQATIQSAIVNSITTKMRKIKEIIGILKGKAPEGQGSLFPFLKNE